MNKCALTALSAVLFTFGGTASAADPLPPVALFASRPVVSMPRLSPDGNHLLLSKRVPINGRDTQLIYVHRTADLAQVAQVRLPKFHVPANFWWASNTRIVVAPGKEYGSIEAPERTGELLAMDWNGENQEYLFGADMAMYRRNTVANDYASANVAGVSDERDGRFFINEHQWASNTLRTNLYAINAKGGTRRLITDAPLPGAHFLMQRDGTARYAYAWDEKDIQVLQMDPATKTWKVKENVGDERIRPLAYAEADSALYAHVRKGSGPYSLIRESNTGERTRLASDPIGSIEHVQWSAKSLKPIVAASLVGIPRPQYMEPESAEAKLHKDLTAQFNGFVNFHTFSDDGQTLLFSVATDKNPGQFYLLNRQTNKAQFLFNALPGIDPANMAERRPIHFRARDGVELHGYLTLPKGVPEKNLPLVLMPHTGPHYVADDWFFHREAQFIASRGYAVLQVNFRGSTGRGDAFHSAAFQRWGDLLMDDLLDGVRWTVTQGIADQKRVCSYGGGRFGGYAAVMVTLRDPAAFQCAIGYSGLYDLASLHESDIAKRSAVWRSYYVRMLGNDPGKLAVWSPSTQADKMKVPVLLAHGDEDELAPAKQAKAMREALVKAGKPHEWMLADAEGHGYYAEHNRIAFLEKVEAFLAKHIGK